MRSPLRVAVLQMATSPLPRANAARVVKALEAAAGRAAHLLLVPECAMSGYLPDDDLDFDALARAEDQVVARAADLGLYLCLGTARRSGARLMNAARLYSPAGVVVASYDKTHLTDGDARVFGAGSELPVFSVGEWTVGLQICFDMRFPENWCILRKKGAELVLHLSSASTSAGWKVPVLAGAVRSRAAENGMFVASANDARAPQMMVSAVYGPDGVELASAPENEEALLVVELDRRAVTHGFHAHRRTDLWSEPEHRDLLLG